MTLINFFYYFETPMLSSLKKNLMLSCIKLVRNSYISWRIPYCRSNFVCPGPRNTGRTSRISFTASKPPTRSSKRASFLISPRSRLISGISSSTINPLFTFPNNPSRGFFTSKSRFRFISSRSRKVIF